MKKIAPPALDRAVELLREAAPEATIVLFGSRARGDAHADSDVDLLVVEPRVRSRHREMVRLTDVLRPLRLRVDLLVVSRRLFREWADVPGTVIYQAAKEGKVLHAAA
jgi:predicted nucleotidyltransferase